MTTVSVCETFVSIQGESSWSGMPCFFIRLSGCNLRCRYCDSVHAYAAGEARAVDGLVAEAASATTPLVEVTGGEPLVQQGTPYLLQGLRTLAGRTVLVETNGSQDISMAPEGVVIVMDVKCPGSGESASLDPTNIERLRPRDEVKFVLSGRADYAWARDFMARHDLHARVHAVLFSPVWGRLEAHELGRWIVEDRLPVRLQVQLHRLLEMR